MSLLVLGVLSVACESPTAPALPAGARPLPRPDVYEAWWQMVEACSGKQGDLARVSWYRVPPGDADGGFEIDGESYAGYWYGSGAGDRIALVAGRELDGHVVRHEMLHALLRRGDHARAAFVEGCGGVVDCAEGCDALGEGGRGVPAGAREVTAAALEVSLAAAPAAPSLAADGGWFTLTVSARNPAAEPVWVRLPDEKTFIYVPLGDDGHAGTYRTTAERRWAFRAGETRRYVFDLRYPPGTYTFAGWFGWRASPRIAVTVGP